MSDRMPPSGDPRRGPDGRQQSENQDLPPTGGATTHSPRPAVHGGGGGRRRGGWRLTGRGFAVIAGAALLVVGLLVAIWPSPPPRIVVPTPPPSYHFGAYVPVTPTLVANLPAGAGGPGPLNLVQVAVTGVGSPAPLVGVAGVRINVLAVTRKATILKVYPDGHYGSNMTVWHVRPGRHQLAMTVPTAENVAVDVFNGGRSTVGIAVTLLGYFRGGPEGIGADVSWPQCPHPLPVAPAFTIIGVNGGRPATANPCLGEQLTWASGAGGPVAGYLNTANPGPRNVLWPHGDTLPGVGRVGVPGGYGACHGGGGLACSYIYGDEVAGLDLAQDAPPVGKVDTYWLDVEVANAWRSDQAANRAVLEGMVARLHRAGIHVGIYALPTQFDQLVGDVPAGSDLSGLPSWLPGAVTRAQALTVCKEPGLTGGPVSRAQYTLGPTDFDVTCPTR